MILECAGCHHSYDVSGYRAEQRLRCHCGQILVVPKETHHYHKAQTLHCSNCGGHLKKGEEHCRYCNALVDLTHARLNAYCASCLAMSPEGAQYCSGCGKALVTSAGAPRETGEKCPRCVVKMRSRDLGEHPTLECPICCGLFVEIEILEQLIHKHKEEATKLSGVPGAGPNQATLEKEQVTYVKCPVCENVMNRLNYGRISGVIVDYCREHGYWLDAGELEKVAEWVATGGLEKQKDRELEDSKTELRRQSMMKAESVRMGEESAYGRRANVGTGFLGVVSKLFDV